MTRAKAGAIHRPAKARPIWRAGDDLEAHVHLTGAIRTLCGRVPVRQVWEWPAETRCPVCTVQLALRLEASS